MNEFIMYLFADLKDHVEKLKDESYMDSPDSERIDYHYEKINGIIRLIEEKGFGGTVNVIDTKIS